MTLDAQHQSISGANREAVEHFDKAVRAFTLNYGNALADVTQTLQLVPECPMAKALKLWMQVLSNDTAQLTQAVTELAQQSTVKLNEREIAHFTALGLAAQGSWPSAVRILDRHLMNFPHDLVAHQCALRLDGYLGRFHRTAGRVARALPFWSESQAGYGIVLSFYGFGLEEFGDYKHAEDIGRHAASLEPYGYWPHHTVTHVLEMTGRPELGIVWMNERQALWADALCNNRVHIWWHKALYHLDLGQFDDALSIYDTEIVPTIKPVGTQLCNLTALLWRIETLGCNVEDRWLDQHVLWSQQTSGICSPFNEIHASVTALKAKDYDKVEQLLVGMRRMESTDSEIAVTYREVAVPIVEAFALMNNHDYSSALDLFLTVQPELWRMGGSVAQRDLIEWTLVVCAIRAGNYRVASSLVNERIARRPDSKINQHFLSNARSLSACV